MGVNRFSWNYELCLLATLANSTLKDVLRLVAGLHRLLTYLLTYLKLTHVICKM